MKYLTLILILFNIACTAKLPSSTPTLDNVAHAQYEGKWGLYQVGKGWLVDPVYENPDDHYPPYNGLIRVKDSIDVGFNYYDLDMELAFKVLYPFSGNFFSDYAYFLTQNTAGFINKNGEVVFESGRNESDYVSDIVIEGRYIWYYKAKLFHVYDLVNNKVVYTSVENAKDFSLIRHDLAIVGYEGGYGLQNLKTGEWVLKPVFQSIKSRPNLIVYPFVRDFTNIMLVVEDSAGKFLYDLNGIKKYNNSIQHVKYMINNRSVLLQNDKYGSVDINGNILVPPKYDYFFDESVGEHGLYAFFIGLKAGVVSVKDEVIVPFEYENIKIIDGESFMFKRGGKWGIKKINGEVVLNPIYDDMLMFPTTKYIIAIRDGKHGIIDREGKELTPFIFDRLGFL